VNAEPEDARTIGDVDANRGPTVAVRFLRLTSPVRRTAGFLSSGAASRRRRRFDQFGIPSPERSPAVAFHVALDELTLSTMKVLRREPPPEFWETELRETSEAVELFERRGWTADPHAYLGHPPELTEPDTRAVRTSAGRLLRLSFPSGWAPRPEEPGASRWTAADANHRARAHVLEHPNGRGRPWVVLIHGTGMGYPDADVRSLGATHFFRDLGCNVVMPILPMHGSRRPPRESRIEFPGLDVLDDVHGLAQSAWDVRRLISWVRSAREPTGIALAGISLGGYVAALVAGLEIPLSCVVCMVPASDFPALLRRHVRRGLRESPVFQEYHARSELLHGAVSPLRLEPATPVSRRFIVAGTADRLIDPVEQVGPLWRHWGEPAIHWMPQGHVGHLLRPDTRRFVDTALMRSGVFHAAT
jgi:hypothetical protein